MLERLKKSIDRSIVSAGVQSTTYLEVGKLRSKIDGVHGNIQQLIMEMGNGIYLNWKNGTDNVKYIEDMCTRICDLEKEIEAYKTKIDELQKEKERVLNSNGGTAAVEANEMVCICGQKNEPDAKFCIGCGKKLDKVKEELSVQFCTNCGSQLESDARFCPNCGMKHEMEQSKSEK